MCYYFSKTKSVSLARERSIAAKTEDGESAGDQHTEREMKMQEEEKKAEEQEKTAVLLK